MVDAVKTVNTICIMLNPGLKVKGKQMNKMIAYYFVSNEVKKTFSRIVLNKSNNRAAF